jgi:hypothetical protein
MPEIQKIDIIQHALDNGINDEDYTLREVLAAPKSFDRTAPDPCDILPRQFGFWFHTGPGFADLQTRTYRHVVYEASDVRVLGQDGIVVYRGNWIDSMSLNYVSEDNPASQFRRLRGGLTIGPPARHLMGSHFMGFNSGHRNYAHWTTDHLPLLQYYKVNLLSQGVRLLLPKNKASFVEQYIALLQIPDSSIDYIGDEVVAVEHLIYSSFFSFDAIPASIIGLLRDFKTGALQKGGERRKGIFVSRSDTHIRTLLNEPAISRSLSGKGFDIVVPGKMTVEAQIDAFRSADCVVGAHGAGLANIMFCEPGTRVIELFPEYTVSPHFWMLASHFGLDYGAVFGTSFDQDAALSDQRGSWEAPFLINEVALVKALGESRRNYAV